LAQDHDIKELQKEMREEREGGKGETRKLMGETRGLKVKLMGKRGRRGERRTCGKNIFRGVGAD